MGRTGGVFAVRFYWRSFRHTAPARPTAPTPAMPRVEGSGTVTRVAADASEQSTNMLTASVNRRTRIRLSIS